MLYTLLQFILLYTELTALTSTELTIIFIYVGGKLCTFS